MKSGLILCDICGLIELNCSFLAVKFPTISNDRHSKEIDLPPWEESILAS